MLPLNTGWRIFADDLPARLTESENDTAFHLPGADALADFSDLLGENACPDSSEAAPTDAPFPPPFRRMCAARQNCGSIWISASCTRRTPSWSLS